MSKNKAQKKSHTSKKLAVVGIVLVVCVLVIAAVSYTVKKYGTTGTLTAAVQNTLKLQQVKFHVDMSSFNSGQGTSDLAMDGLYKKGAGLSATATSTMNTSGVQEEKQSRWVLDPSGTAYANLSLLNVKITNSKSPLNTPTNVQNVAMASKLNTENNKDVWEKIDTANLKYSQDSYGLQACTLVAFYMVQSNPHTFQDFTSQLAGSGNLSIKKSGSTYTIAANAGNDKKIDDLYTKSDLYKSLVACDQSQYGGPSRTINDILQRTTVSATIDNASKTISSVAVDVQDGVSFKATIASTSGVTITVPKVSTPPPLTAQNAATYLQQYAPYLYKNLLNVQNSVNK